MFNHILYNAAELSSAQESFENAHKLRKVALARYQRALDSASAGITNKNFENCGYFHQDRLQKYDAVKSAYSKYCHSIECTLSAHEKNCEVYNDGRYKVYWGGLDSDFVEGTGRQLEHIYDVIKDYASEDAQYDIRKETVGDKVVVTFTDKKTGRVAVCPDADSLCVYIGEMQIDWLVHRAQCGMCRSI